jgi:thymidine kinase
MFSGKTERLVERLIQATDHKHVVVALKPRLDDRYANDAIISHSGKSFPAQPIDTKEPCWLGCFTSMHDLVGIDEVQFFGPWIVPQIENLLVRGVDVTVSGLDLTYKAEPFGVMPQLLCFADVIHKLCATCAKCGAPANRSRRTVESDAAVLVGGKEAYEPRCLGCFR